MSSSSSSFSSPTSGCCGPRKYRFPASRTTIGTPSTLIGKRCSRATPATSTKSSPPGRPSRPAWQPPSSRSSWRRIPPPVWPCTAPPSTATLESRDYLESPPHLWGQLAGAACQGPDSGREHHLHRLPRADRQQLSLENGTPTGLIQLDGEGVATVQPITFKQKGAGRGIPLWGEPDRKPARALRRLPCPKSPLRMEDGVEAEGTTTFQVTARRLPDRNHLDGASGIPARHRDSKRQPLRCKRHRQPHLQPACAHHHLGHCCHLRGTRPTPTAWKSPVPPQAAAPAAVAPPGIPSPCRRKTTAPSASAPAGLPAARP